MRERPISVLIFGILNLGFGVFGLLGLLTQNSFGSLATNSPLPWLNSIVVLLDTMYKSPSYLTWRAITNPLECAVNLALLAAGVGLLRMKNWARLASIGYALYQFVFVIANLGLLFVVLGGPLRKSMQDVPALVEFLIGACLLGGLVVSLTYPALLLFFLTRPKITSAFRPQAGTPLSP